ncbi:Acetyltransferase [Thermoplasmatales archaeon BRNA1]|nr:Acetyltransferase [Thermoplasmatales archaeon BRNA1]
MRPGDGDGAYEVLCSSLDEYFAREVLDYFMMQWPAGSFVAVDYAGRIMGYIAGSRLQNGRAAVSLLCVNQLVRGRGVGESLLAHLRQAARMEGIRTIQLEVRTTNTEAIRFYERRGFKPVESLPRFYNDGGDGIRMISSSSESLSNS